MDVTRKNETSCVRYRIFRKASSIVAYVFTYIWILAVKAMITEVKSIELQKRGIK